MHFIAFSDMKNVVYSFRNSSNLKKKIDIQFLNVCKFKWNTSQCMKIKCIL